MIRMDLYGTKYNLSQGLNATDRAIQSAVSDHKGKLNLDTKASFQIVDSFGDPFLYIEGTAGVSNDKLVELGDYFAQVIDVQVRLSFGTLINCNKGEKFDEEIVDIARAMSSCDVNGTISLEEVKEKLGIS